MPASMKACSPACAYSAWIAASTLGRERKLRSSGGAGSATAQAAR
jgi:hypothetical protein